VPGQCGRSAGLLEARGGDLGRGRWGARAELSVGGGLWWWVLCSARARMAGGMEQVVGGKFKLGKKIGSGSFGELYLGVCCPVKGSLVARVSFCLRVCCGRPCVLLTVLACFGCSRERAEW
jgi:hypothetical protein